jgi:RNase adapter protein RapZ
MSIKSPASVTPVLLVSGMSGAGKASTLKILEDLGYEAVDNLPLSLLPNLAASAGAGGKATPGRALAVGIDSRTRDYDPGTFADRLAELRQRPDLGVRLLFLDCDDEVLQNRFTATRRRHPLAGDRRLSDGIAIERRLMAPLRDYSDLTIDTSHLAQPELRQLLAAHFALDAGPGINLMVTSFAFGRGLPREADLVFDVRFLSNPHYREALRPRTGEDAEVGAYIAADPAFPPFFQGLGDLLLGLLPHYEREGKRYLTVAVGCTGGRHRSVFVAIKLAQLLTDEGYRISLRHRDKDKPVE